MKNIRVKFSMKERTRKKGDVTLRKFEDITLKDETIFCNYNSDSDITVTSMQV